MYKSAIVITLTILILGFASYFSKPKEDFKDTEIKKLYKIPDAYNEYFKNKDDLYIVNIFASWCRTCMQEHKNLEKIKDKFDVKFYGIALNDNERMLKQAIGEELTPYDKVAFFFPQQALVEIRARQIPRTLIIYKGNVIMDRTGPITKELNHNVIFPILNKLTK